MNISSIIIKAHSEKWQSTLEALSRLSTPSSTLEIALEDEAKGLIIATIEASSTCLLYTSDAADELQAV